MKKSRSRIVALGAALALAACSATHPHFYGTPLDLPGPGLLLWPMDEEGASFRYVIQDEDGVGSSTEVHALELPRAGDWALAGELELTTILLFLPTEPSPSLRRAGLEIQTELALAYPRASAHLLRGSIEPYRVQTGAELEARLNDLWFQHLGLQPMTWGEVLGNVFLGGFASSGIAEVGVVPLAGDEPRFAVYSLLPDEEECASLREAGFEDLGEAIREVGETARAAWVASESPAARYHPLTGDVVVRMPGTTSVAARQALEQALHALQESAAAAVDSAEAGSLPPLGGHVSIVYDPGAAYEDLASVRELCQFEQAFLLLQDPLW